MNALELEQVTKRFTTVTAVDELSLAVPAGCVYGFLGPNGAGKTTTLRMVMGIIYPDAGTLRVLGSPSADAVKDRLGYLPEERGLYRKMKVGEILYYLGVIKGVPRNELRARIDRWLDTVELSGWRNRRVEELSKGMQQKLQFAATMIGEPELLILDEPFGGLDPLNVDLMIELILDFKRQGRTIIFSTHVMEQAEKLCDYLLLINKGRKVVDGTLAQIRSRYETQSVLVEADGDLEFLPSLPMVARVQANAHHLEVVLSNGQDSQGLLRALAERTHVRRFEIKLPSLHDIFIHLVKEDT